MSEAESDSGTEEVTVSDSEEEEGEVEAKTGESSLEESGSEEKEEEEGSDENEKEDGNSSEEGSGEEVSEEESEEESGDESEDESEDEGESEEGSEEEESEIEEKIEENQVASAKKRKESDATESDFDYRDSPMVRRVKRLSSGGSRSRAASVKVGKRFVVNREGQIFFKGNKISDVQISMETCLKYALSQKIEKQKITKRDKKKKDDKMFTLDEAKQINQRSEQIGDNIFFREYQRVLFMHIREAFGIEEIDFLQSIVARRFRLMGYPGKSGSLFFSSHDGKYIIKTITKKDKVFLFKFLPRYVTFIKGQPNTLLCRFLGSYRIKIKGKKNIRFIIMNNFFHTPLNIHKRYDLKGSSVGRNVKKEEIKEKMEECIYKDNDLNNKCYLGKYLTWRVLKQIDADTKFLAGEKIMDYSLLLGINNPGVYKKGDTPQDQIINFRPAENQPEKGVSIFQQATGGCCSSVLMENGQRSHYFFGIIDILQPYNFKKRVEFFGKGLLYKRGMISCQPPGDYRVRFCTFMKRLFILGEEEEKKK